MDTETIINELSERVLASYKSQGLVENHIEQLMASAIEQRPQDFIETFNDAMRQVVTDRVAEAKANMAAGLFGVPPREPVEEDDDDDDFDDDDEDELDDDDEGEELAEKWDTDYETPKSKRGMFKGRSLSSLEKQAKHAHGTKAKQVNFAIRAKTGWGKVKEETKLGEDMLLPPEEIETLAQEVVDTFKAENPEVEVNEAELLELSKKTLGSYIKKSAVDMHFTNPKSGKGWDKRINKRMHGISKAVKRLTKEDK